MCLKMIVGQVCVILFLFTRHNLSQITAFEVTTDKLLTLELCPSCDGLFKENIFP